MSFTIRSCRACVFGFWSFITLLLLGSSAPACAEWIPIGTSDEGATIIYMDTDTIHRRGDLVKMWDLMDYQLAQKTDSGSAYLSSKTQTEYDCSEERSRVLTFSFHSGNMGSGHVVSSSVKEQTWSPVALGTVGQRLWKYACTQR